MALGMELTAEAALDSGAMRLPGLGKAPRAGTTVPGGSVSPTSRRRSVAPPRHSLGGPAMPTPDLVVARILSGGGGEGGGGLGLGTSLGEGPSVHSVHAWDSPAAPPSVIDHTASASQGSLDGDWAGASPSPFPFPDGLQRPLVGVQDLWNVDPASVMTAASAPGQYARDATALAALSAPRRRVSVMPVTSSSVSAFRPGATAAGGNPVLRRDSRALPPFQPEASGGGYAADGVGGSKLATVTEAGTGDRLLGTAQPRKRFDDEFANGRASV
jgi:hypothetical protein